MKVKTYVPQGSGPGMPVGGVDFQPEAKGQQMLPEQPAAPMGAVPPQPSQPAGQMPPQGQNPQGPQSNILQMTPQGQAMAAMKATPPPGMPPPKMAGGGSTTPSVEEMKRALGKFLEPSKVKERMYHATHSDFNAFRNNHRGVHFLTPSPKFADDFLTNSGQDEHEEGANIMPVHVQVKNPFDYQNKKHVDALGVKASIGKIGLDQIKKGDWNRIEDRTTLKAIKNLGHDAVYVNEGGVKNLGVFNPNAIKSAIGNRGTYDTSKDDLSMATGGTVKDYIRVTERKL